MGMTDGSDTTRLPLFPLPDVVHFPRTELRIHVTDPRHRQLIHNVLEQDEEVRWIGMVLLKPGQRYDAGGLPEIFPGGTAGRLVEAEPFPDGSVQVLLVGDFRFELQREVGHGRFREAVVRPVPEPPLNEQDAGIVTVRRAVLDLVGSLAAEMGERFPFSAEEIELLGEHCDFEELINRLAAHVDLPPLRKLQLLIESLPERGLSLLSILRSRRQVLDLLRPFRRLAGSSEHN